MRADPSFRVLGFGVVAVAIALVPLARAADKSKGARADESWTAPGFAARHIQGIAALPPASYDRNHIAERTAAGLWGQALKDVGYRWQSPLMVQTMMSSPADDSLLQQTSASVLAHGRVDSTLAPRLCAALRTDAVLSLRLDRWEQIEMEYNQAGRPSTTVQVTASLVDAAGHELWRISGSETGEGPYHDPNANVLGVWSSDLANKPLTGQGGAPAFAEVATKLFARWAPKFPAPPAATDSTSAAH